MDAWVLKLLVGAWRRHAVPIRLPPAQRSAGGLVARLHLGGLQPSDASANFVPNATYCFSEFELVLA